MFCIANITHFFVAQLILRIIGEKVAALVAIFFEVDGLDVDLG